MNSNQHGGKKLADMNREELLAVVQRLILAMEKKRQRERQSNYLPDLPPNKKANARHQRMKGIWGRKKRELMRMLHETLPYVPVELANEICDALNHEEHLWQKKRRRRLRQRTKAI